VGIPALPVVIAALLATGSSADPPRVRPGGVVRWAGPELVECSRDGRSWLPVDGACWYAIDLDETGRRTLVRRSSGGIASRVVEITPYPYPTQRLQVEEKYVAPPASEVERIARERAEVVALFSLETTPRWHAPLGSPLSHLPEPSRFGARRVFNGRPRSPHSGADFDAPLGTPVFAVAAGRVVLAADQYFAGRAVYVDHGGGLLSMSFHLSQISVHRGEEVRRGDLLGYSGASGRVTGPHLHFGLRLHGARIDPELLLGRVAAVELR